ncbi:MAG: hypothetical protein GY731_11080, partial [Gammaproteobacteria bacterium]|nr:hypothetical protein [Gammaproteobacteria bacterium]
EQACRKLARLDVGARRLLFHEGIPLDIDMLLGRGDGAVEGKTRISVIYLNTLHSQEDKEYFVAALTQRLYTWMLDNPSKTPQALFYIDEVAPYIPPVRKPACKDGLTLLFKQARKYGIGCLMATQNPADVDYKAMAQFGTWVLGRLTTRQDLKKVQPMVKSLDPSHVEAVMDQLPAQKPGEFLLISPDNFDSTRPIRARWLYTRHETLDEDRINQLANERWRWRFPVPVGKSARETGKEHPRTAKMVKPVPERADTPRSAPAPSKIKTEADMLNAMEPPQDLKLVQQAALLARTASMSAGEFATRTKVAESTARSTLKRLVGAGLAGRFKEGRSTRFWAIENGLRPDLGLTDRVKIIVPLITRAEAERLGHNLRERALLGMIGDDEELVDTKMEYRPLYRISFQEKVRRPLWKRLFSRREFEHRAESVYLHPRSLKLVVFKPGDGISLHERPEELASEIEDFDGVVRFEERAPGKIRIDEHEWQERRPEESLVGRFQALYQIRPEKVEPVFVPFWRLHLRVPGKPGTRIVIIDALSGFPLDW